MVSNGVLDIQVVGGGILGILVAMLAAERGLRVRVYRMGERLRPDADSLRNHSWLQSGLLYGQSLDRVSVLKMRESGIGLLERFGISPELREDERGVFALHDEQDKAVLWERAAEIRCNRYLRQLSGKEANEKLHAFYDSDRIYVTVPDTIFPEGEVMERARDVAQNFGAEIVNVTSPVVFRSVPENRIGVAIEHENEISHSPVIIVAAGCRTGPMLKSIGLERPLEVWQSSLLIARDSPDVSIPRASTLLNVPIFADRATGLTVANHRYSGGRPGCLVIGNRDRRKIRDEKIGDKREVQGAECEALMKLLPTRAREEIAKTKLRYTAGHKTELNCPEKGLSVAAWIEEFKERPGLYAAIPGKATNAWHCANKIVSYLERDSGLQKPSLAAGKPITWSDRISLHHESYYDDFNEA